MTLKIPLILQVRRAARPLLGAARRAAGSLIGAARAATDALARLFIAMMVWSVPAGLGYLAYGSPGLRAVGLWIACAVAAFIALGLTLGWREHPPTQGKS